MNCLNSYSLLVQMAGIEPARFIQPQDFKSCASASSATSASNVFYAIWALHTDTVTRFARTVSCKFRHICIYWHLSCDILNYTTNLYSLSSSFFNFDKKDKMFSGGNEFRPLHIIYYKNMLLLNLLHVIVMLKDIS